MVLNVSAMPWAISTRNIVFKNFFTLPIVVDSLLLTSSLQPAHLLHERGGQQRHQGQRQQELPGERHELVIPESWFFSYAIPNHELLPKACLAASPTPPSPEKTAQRNLFHLRRKTGRCLVLSVWIDVCVSVSLVIFDNSAQVLSSYFNGLKTRQPLQTQLLPIQENFDLRECQSPVNWELVNMKYLVVLFLLLYCRHV